MMTEDKQNNKVDKIFRDGLQSHKDQPSRDLWTKIKTDLEKDDLLISLNRRRRNLLIISGLLLIIMGSGVIYLRNTNIRFNYGQEDKVKP
jgi:hypothetical protein